MDQFFTIHSYVCSHSLSSNMYTWGKLSATVFSVMGLGKVVSGRRIGIRLSLMLLHCLERVFYLLHWIKMSEIFSGSMGGRSVDNKCPLGLMEQGPLTDAEDRDEGDFLWIDGRE